MFAWIVNNVVRDTNNNPTKSFTPDIAAFYDTVVPVGTKNGYIWHEPTQAWVDRYLQWDADNEVFITPEPAPAPTPEPEVVVAPMISPVEFKLLFTSTERIDIKTARATDPILDDFYEILEDPRLTQVDLGLQSTIDGIGYLALQGLIRPERIPEILSGALV